MKLSEKLEHARSRIENEKYWTRGALHRAVSDTGSSLGLSVAYCAVGAIIYSSFSCVAPFEALFAVLKKRYFQGTLPEAKFGPDMRSPTAWEKIFNSEPHQDWTLVALAQFNNSTMHADVLSLFDEAIADAETKEAAERQVLPFRHTINIAKELEHVGT
jgi:hypothetical protein